MHNNSSARDGSDTELMILMTLIVSKTSFNKCIHVYYDIRQIMNIRIKQWMMSDNVEISNCHYDIKRIRTPYAVCSDYGGSVVGGSRTNQLSNQFMT